MTDEEYHTFPYALTIASLHKKKDKAGYRKIRKTYSMKKFGKEHSNMEEKLLDLKNLLLKYLPQPFDTDTCNRIIIELANLERDIRDHSRIEEKILKPIVEKMEKELEGK